MLRRTALTLTSIASLAVGCAKADADPSFPAPMAPPAAMDGDTAGGRDYQQPGAPPATEAPADVSEARQGPSMGDIAPAPRQRPGLATSWGEQRHSKVSSAKFRRGDKTTPFAVGKVFYNDPKGIAAMSDSNPGARRNQRRFAVGSGHVDIGLRDGGGHFLTGFRMGGENYLAGVAGRRYTIVVNNHSPGRIEAVVSVDGLDVIDGKSASIGKRGYLIDPFGNLEIEGFRTSTDQVAAFRFGSVANSYANKKHGDARNVGVIGVALFHESGDNPHLWGTARTHEDVRQRHGADPFPTKFASPP